MNRKRCAVLTLVAGLFGANPSHAAMLQVDGNGILTGATGVDVSGTLYDVTFQDGSCNSLFNNCDPARFAFTSLAFAEAAARALLAQVFINTDTGKFDDDPLLTRGCFYPGDYYTITCSAFTPAVVAGSVSGAVAYNQLTVDAVIDYGIAPSNDTTGLASYTYAVWSRPPGSSVPEPGALSLLGAGLLAAAVAYRRRKQS